MIVLTKDERLLLEWLSREDFNSYGACHGRALDGLVQKGLAKIHSRDNGRGLKAQMVSVTEAGIAELKDIKP